MSHGVAGTLRIGVLAQIRLEIVLEDGLQSLPHMLTRQRCIDSIHPCHPRANDSVRQAPVTVLILGSFALQQSLHLAAVFVDLRDHGGKRRVLDIELSVENIRR